MPGSDSVFKVNLDLDEKGVEKKAEALGVPYIKIANIPLANDLAIVQEVLEEDAKRAQLIPFSKNGLVLNVAVVDPNALETKKLLTKLKEKNNLTPQVFLCSANGLAKALLIYESNLLHKKTLTTKKEFDENQISTVERRTNAFETLNKKIATLPSKLIVNAIEIAAIQARASDIHMQPEGSRMYIRFRIDGILHQVCTLDPKKAEQLVMYIKYEGGMQSNITNVPQSGRKIAEINDRRVDIRISTLPTGSTESVVMRILDAEKSLKDFLGLGFLEHDCDKINSAISRTNGMTLVTGPTGSGKTTTLYSMLAKINSSETKIVTMEDPIEYHLPGICQSQVNEKDGYSFGDGLKAVLRHDPNVIFIGEIRDLQTAKLATEASLTGHTVFSSLHTNSAVGTITRLRNLGMNDYNIAPALNAIFAQRLIRKVCECAKKVAVTNDAKLMAQLSRIKRILPMTNIPQKITEKAGCKKCFNTGYMNRMIISEALLVDTKLKKLISQGVSDLDITKFLMEETDFLTMFEDGLLKVLAGETTLEEVYRVAGEV